MHGIVALVHFNNLKKNKINANETKLERPKIKFKIWLWKMFKLKKRKEIIKSKKLRFLRVEPRTKRKKKSSSHFSNNALLFTRVSSKVTLLTQFFLLRAEKLTVSSSSLFDYRVNYEASRTISINLRKHVATTLPNPSSQRVSSPMWMRKPRAIEPSRFIHLKKNSMLGR